MTRCKEFYDKVERDGFDWCEKDKGTVSRINSYLKVVNELTDEGIEKKLSYCNFSQNASRPLNKVDDPDIRGEVISLIAKAIARGDQPSEADVKVWIDLASGIDPVKKLEEKKDPARPPSATASPTTSPTPTAQTVADIAHVDVSAVLPAENKSPFISGSDIKAGLVDLDTPDTRTEPPKLVLKSPPNVSQIPPCQPEVVTIIPTRGMWRSIDDDAKTGAIKPDEKNGKDIWQVGMMRALEAGFEVLMAGERP